MKHILLMTLIGVSLSCGCAGPKDFDVVASTNDPNGLPLNPKWGQQTRPGENTLPNPYVSCPAQSYTLITDPFFVFSSEDWTTSSTHPNCTSVPVTFNGGALCGPHVNFETVTYEGTVTWNGHAADDDDYDLDVRRDDSALYSSTSGGRVHVEFDSDETVDNWDDTGTWWNSFHHNGVDHLIYPEGPLFPISDGFAQASAMINGSFVIVTGELNMDSSHSAKTEIHPVYAMFVRLPSSDFRRSVWAFFVRNWGDEGFCSDGDQPFETREHKIKVQIPNVAGLISYNASEGAQNEDQLSAMQASMQPSGDGVLMTFTLLQPNKQSWFVGDLTFVARPPESLPISTAAPASQNGGSLSGDTEAGERLDRNLQALEARIGKLPADSRLELQRQLEALTPRKKSVPVKIAVLFEPAKDEDKHPSPLAKVALPPGSRQTKRDPTTELRRQKKIEFIKQYLAEREKKNK